MENFSSESLSIVRGDRSRDDDAYEATMPHSFGIDASVGSRSLNVHLAELPPGQRTRAHYHLSSDAAGYILEGEVTIVSYTKDHQRVEAVARAGDFMFSPAGYVHQLINHGSVPMRLVGIYENCQYDEDGTIAGKFYVEDAQE